MDLLPLRHGADLLHNVLAGVQPDHTDLFKSPVFHDDASCFWDDPSIAQGRGNIK